MAQTGSRCPELGKKPLLCDSFATKEQNPGWLPHGLGGPDLGEGLEESSAFRAPSSATRVGCGEQPLGSRGVAAEF